MEFRRTGERVGIGIGDGHLLAVAVDLAVLTPHAVGDTREPDRVLGVGARDQERVAGSPDRQTSAG